MLKHEKCPELNKVLDHQGVNPVKQTKLQEVQRTCG